MANPPLRLISVRRGIAATVLVRQTTLDDLVDEVHALATEAFDLAERALPLARQLELMATALGPTSGAIARELVGLLERQLRRHDPRKAA